MAQSAASPILNPMDVAQDIIRPTEDVKVAIDARSAPIPDDTQSVLSEDSWAGHDHELPLPRRKILAVVAHIHPSGKHEQGW